MFATDGRLWIERTTDVGELPLYDVIDHRGRLVLQVRLHTRSRIVGFGGRSIYVARRDNDDVEYLERYVLR
jgi:hypothetical protein